MNGPSDFAIPAEPGRETMQAAVLRPFHWNEDFLVEEQGVVEALVPPDPRPTLALLAAAALLPLEAEQREQRLACPPAPERQEHREDCGRHQDDDVDVVRDPHDRPELGLARVN